MYFNGLTPTYHNQSIQRSIQGSIAAIKLHYNGEAHPIMAKHWWCIMSTTSPAWQDGHPYVITNCCIPIQMFTIHWYQLLYFKKIYQMFYWITYAWLVVPAVERPRKYMVKYQHQQLQLRLQRYSSRRSHFFRMAISGWSPGKRPSLPIMETSYPRRVRLFPGVWFLVVGS